MFASLLILGLLLDVAAVVLLRAVVRTRRRVRSAKWLLTRTAAAIGEAERSWRVTDMP